MGTHWLGEDFLRPLPQRVHRQRPPYPPDFHVGLPFGGTLYRDFHKIRELKRLEVQTVVPAHERAPNAAGTLGAVHCTRTCYLRLALPRAASVKDRFDLGGAKRTVEEFDLIDKTIEMPRIGGRWGRARYSPDLCADAEEMAGSHRGDQSRCWGFRHKLTIHVQPYGGPVEDARDVMPLAWRKSERITTKLFVHRHKDTTCSWDTSSA